MRRGDFKLKAGLFGSGSEKQFPIVFLSFGLVAGPSADEFANRAGVGDQGKLSGAVAVLPTVVGRKVL